MAASNIFVQPIHLGLGAKAKVQPPMAGMEWYADYAARTADDGREGRLVSAFSFTENWRVWEMHPAGDEVAICLSGTMTLHQELADGTCATVTLEAGESIVNPPGCWHTADVDGPVSALFITAGAGTEHRPR